MMITQSSQDA
jgi:hypothetical protein